MIRQKQNKMMGIYFRDTFEWTSFDKDNPKVPDRVKGKVLSYLKKNKIEVQLPKDEQNSSPKDEQNSPPKDEESSPPDYKENSPNIEEPLLLQADESDFNDDIFQSMEDDIQDFLFF